MTSNNVLGMAVVDVNDSHIGCLIHRGVREEVGNKWKESLILWDVGNFSTLRTLFQAAQHALGVLKMPQAAARRLYGDSTSDGCPTEE